MLTDRFAETIFSCPTEIFTSHYSKEITETSGGTDIISVNPSASGIFSKVYEKLNKTKQLVEARNLIPARVTIWLSRWSHKYRTGSSQYY